MFNLYKVPYEDYGEEGLRLIWQAVDRFGSDVRAYRQLGKIRAYLSPGQELILLSYSEEAMRGGEDNWGPVERVCRGLIVHWPSRTVRAWPYNKFFNYGQRPETRPEALAGYTSFVTTVKMDGSLAVGFYNEKGDPTIATKGYFLSDQAAWATDWLRKRGIRWEPYLTPMFEIIYPENQVVLGYGPEMTGLHLHGARDLRTGRELNFEEVENLARLMRVPSVTSHEAASLASLTALVPNMSGIEGFVVTFPDFHRIKMKTAEYLELHRIVTNYRPGRVVRWVTYLEPEQVEELFLRFPDELYEEASKVRHDFLEAVGILEGWVRAAYAEILAELPPDPSQKQVAAAIVAKSKETGLHRALFFELYNNDTPARFLGMIMERATGIRGLAITRYNVFKHLPSPEQRLRHIMKQDQEEDAAEAAETLGAGEIDEANVA